MNQTENRLIVVLGMHRSGTSVITRGLQALGVDLGNNLWPPKANDNEKGFFEDAQITAFNDELLETLGGYWHSLSPIPRAVLERESLADYKRRAIELIHSLVGKQVFGLKDPRIARLLPFWQTVFDDAGMNVSYVIAVRNPMSIVESLERRDGFSVEKGYYLWLGHMLPAIVQTQGHPRVAVNFDSLIADPQAQLKRISQALQLPYEGECQAVAAYISEFLDPSLRHAKHDLEDLRNDSTAPKEVVKLYELLVDFAENRVDPTASGASETLEQLEGSFQSIAPVLHYAARVDNKLTECNIQITALNQTLAQRDRQIAEIVSSKSWALTKPLRYLRRKVFQ